MGRFWQPALHSAAAACRNRGQLRASALTSRRWMAAWAACSDLAPSPPPLPSPSQPQLHRHTFSCKSAAFMIPVDHVPVSPRHDGSILVTWHSAREHGSAEPRGGSADCPPQSLVSHMSVELAACKTAAAQHQGGLVTLAIRHFGPCLVSLNS